MDNITLENYRCFGEKQTARLAPPTLLVGENSTGKTSFLALIRALWDVVVAERVPNFREPPYDLGSFRGIVHQSGRQDRKPNAFLAGFSEQRASYIVTFSEWATIPYPTKRGMYLADRWLELSTDSTRGMQVILGIQNQRFTYSLQERWARDESMLTSLRFVIMDAVRDVSGIGRRSENLGTLLDTAKIEPTDLEPLEREALRSLPPNILTSRPFAGAPVRSKPSRIHEHASPARDVDGEYVPSYLADLSSRNRLSWERLKERLERFGEIQVSLAK